MSYGVVATGFAPKPRSIILAELEAAAVAQYGADTDTSSDSALGILLGIYADALGSAWEQGALTFAGAFPDTATGAAFAALARLTACDRLQPTASEVDLALAGTAGTLVPAGTVFSSGPGTQTVTSSAAVTLTGGTGTARAVASVTGPLAFLAGTITTIDTPVAGLSSVTQPADAVVVGTDLELEEAWRIRREVSLRAIGGASLDGIRARVLRVPGVSECYVFGNDTSTTDADGVPGHGFEVVARHAASATIAQAVLDAVLATKPAGIYAHGTVTGTSTDAGGTARTVRYSTPTPTNIYVDVAVVTDGTETSSSDLTAAIKAAIVATEGRYKIGNNVTASRLVPAVTGVGELVYDVTVLVGTTASPTGTEVVLDRHHVAAFDSSRITVTITHASDV